MAKLGGIYVCHECKLSRLPCVLTGLSFPDRCGDSKKKTEAVWAEISIKELTGYLKDAILLGTVLKREMSEVNKELLNELNKTDAEG